MLVAALPISIRGTPHQRLPIARELTFATDPFADYHKSSYATRETPNVRYTVTRRGARGMLSVVQPGYAAIRRAIIRMRMPHRAA